MLPNTLVLQTEQDPELVHRWSEEKAAAWARRQGWLVGCNYVPHTAINQLEMWQAETFDPFLIDKELGWAEELGFNTVRVFLHHLLWEQDPQGFIERIDLFLGIAHKHGIKTMFVLFDAVWDPFPKLGKQPEPKHNVHNSGWVQCPGYDVLNSPDRYDELHNYVNGIVSHFKDDERVLIWDLYNEPDNMNLGSYKDQDYVQHKADLSRELLRKAIIWVRAINPSQPITMGPWQEDWSEVACLTRIDDYMFSHSDVISFHCYRGAAQMESHILDLQRYNRPMLCTEYMARPFGSTFQDILPVLQKHSVGAYNWGFVAGKSQTHCPWDSWQITYNDEPELWFHDIFRANGEAYKTEEVAFLKKILKEKQTMPVADRVEQ